MPIASTNNTPARPAKPAMYVTMCSFARASGSKRLGASIQQTDEPIYNMTFQPLICCLLHLGRALRSPTTSDPILASAPPQPIVVDDMLHPGHHWIGAAQGKRDATMPREGPNALRVSVKCCRHANCRHKQYPSPPPQACPACHSVQLCPCVRQQGTGCWHTADR
jgi:hypothetical protein